ncbi:MAG: Hsp70 family protein [Lachnospiraceae bacterium]|nr:Hsp70 family protein [Lachnospiraceae bacterium]
MYLGIDLGTTNTVVSRSFLDIDNRLVTEIVPIGQFINDNWEKYPTLPSMIYYDKYGEVGDTQGGIIVGREAKRQREQDRENVVTNAKRFMGTQHTWELDHCQYEAKDIAAMVLQHCKKTIDKQNNMNYETVVITVPASFGPEQIADTIKAAKQAGFKEEQVIIKHEPTAALLSFIDGEARKSKQDRYMDLSETKRILVFDLGGGTCDVAIIDVKVGNHEMRFTEVGLGRYQELGGIDFDTRFAEGLLNTYFRENNILEGDISKAEQKELYNKLVLAAETIKEKLSGVIYTKMSMDEDVDIENVQVTLSIPNFYNNKRFRIQVTKAEYDKYTESLYIDNRIQYKKFEDMDKIKILLVLFEVP